MASLVGTDIANLNDSIQGESYEYGTMYKGLVEEARKFGDIVAAQCFEEIRQDEAKHRDAFKAAQLSWKRGLQRQASSRSSKTL